MTRRTTEDYCGSVEMCDVGLEEDAPELSLWASPPFEDCRLRHSDFCCAAVKHVDLVAVTDGDISCLGKFSTAEK